MFNRSREISELLYAKTFVSGDIMFSHGSAISEDISAGCDVRTWKTIMVSRVIMLIQIVSVSNRRVT